MIYLKKRYITIYQYYIFCSNFDISWYIISFDISIYFWKYRCFFENILRYIANMIYRDISFHDISRYIARYNQIYWYIVIYHRYIAIYWVQNRRYIKFKNGYIADFRRNISRYIAWYIDILSFQAKHSW